MPRGSTPVFDATIARRIRLLALDVDGVLTANDSWIGELDGERTEFKRFDIQDGFGMRLLRGAGIDVAWVTGRESPSTLLRAAELDVATVVTVSPDKKVRAFETILAEKGLGWDEVAFVGDDIPDLPVLERVALPIAVANARPEVKSACRYVTDARGGHGAVREVIDRLLKSRGEFDAAVQRFLAGGKAIA
jgi:3-deoxy-D-manno-octulosonate 8-phosphate phosphatase (KDO 8-P phosphatase)